MCRYQQWDRERHQLGYCPANVVTDGLCQYHADWVADCKDLEGIDRKYPYRVKGRSAARLGKPNVMETVIPPSARRIEFIAWKAGAPKVRAKYSFIQWALDEDKRAIAASEPSPFTADGQSKIARARAAEPTAEDIAEQERQRIEAHAKLEAEQAAFMQRRADAEAKEVKRRADEWKDAQAKMPDTSRPIGKRVADELEIFGRFLVLKPVAPGASACAYFDRDTGIKLAYTLEGVKRMGAEVVQKIVARNHA